MELQPFNPRYAPLVASWIPDRAALTLVAPLAQPPITPDLILRWVEAAEYPFMLLPAPDAPPVAYGELLFPPDLPGIHARHVVVDPRYRGQGYGWTLLERLGHAAHARFAHERLYLTLISHNDFARSLVGAMGFAELGTRIAIPEEGTGQVQLVDFAAPVPLKPYVHRTPAVPETGDAPGYGRGLRSR